LNIRGLGRPGQDVSTHVERQFNAVPWLAYWDIYKQYYANKQEEEGVVIHSASSKTADSYAILSANTTNPGFYGDQDCLDKSASIKWDQTLEITVELYDGNGIPDWDDLLIVQGTNAGIQLTLHCMSVVEISETARKFVGWKAASPGFGTNGVGKINQQVITATVNDNPDQSPKLSRFPLKNIDDMRKYILTRINDATVFTNLFDYAPYNMAYKVTPVDGNQFDYAQRYAQEGLAIKTYQSDLFNNWISTEWIDGTNGINEITSVSTTGDSFTIDALNLASKVYAMLNRIAISGGSYDDWLDAVYTHERSRGTENPVYHGSLIRELAFQEVVSTSNCTL